MIVVVLLGDQSLTDGGPGAVSTRSTHTAALVGFLAVHAGAAQSRQRIAALFWPDSSDAQALTNLRRELHLLRQVLRDDPALVVASRDLCWQDSPTCEVDVSAFMREREAAVAGVENGDLAGVLRHGKAAIARFRGDDLTAVLHALDQGSPAALTVDNLVSADVVLADGSFVTASESSHPDLFWALRGGGGNFGVVTSVTFRCHPIGESGTIIGGPVLYDIADTAAVMRWYRELLPSLPEELSGWIGLITIPGAPPFPEELWGRKACAIVWCYTGAHEQADQVLEPIRTFGSPLVVGLQEMPFNVLQSAFDPLYPAGLQWYWRADVFDEITDEAIDVHCRFGELLPTGHSTMHLYPFDGAASRVDVGATAFPHRNGGWAGVIVGVDPDPANNAAITQWTRDYWEQLHPMSAGGAYVNFLMDEGPDRVRAAYGANHDRLAQVKRRYDPDNTFHVNQNIRPAGPESI
ncbi:BBE domain-containing protein [Pseudonocardia sp. TRM90224]|uniref:BBE domain-containing protein n=1 Tax=Pseudonocardia sp. TRM90224 TaxID=2812678 RepID=UPI001E5CC956|nr:BBE domain-containing protein [Pseudonocardia sp. TRM90224]